MYIYNVWINFLELNLSIIIGVSPMVENILVMMHCMLATRIMTRGLPGSKGLASGSKGREEAGGGIGVIGWETASPNTIFDTGENNNPQLVKARLKQWAQLVACSVRHSC
ncbi:hypothetical protein FRX31_007413 [Thalictrum thalictroides]|uniref:Uncharacterized protein n=1 Tax=Thalictrum thalictroides TaxID=46969 RepID=A0A7J6WZV6_THATH|nr:hypothetical protein FRX31_007413 [Thalictrum thalictroides]